MIVFLCVMISLLVIGGCIEKFIIPRLNPDNKFKIWWMNNVIDNDPHHL